jgi:hypothetical protein
MKILLQSLFVLFFCSAAAFGRQNRPMQKVHAAKMAYMTDRLQLTEEQAVRFIPVYREYEKEFIQIRKPYREKYKLQRGNGDMATARQRLENDLDYQQEVIALKRTYNDRFIKVITPKQLEDLYIAEKEFRQKLVKQLKQRKENKNAAAH